MNPTIRRRSISRPLVAKTLALLLSLSLQISSPARVSAPQDNTRRFEQIWRTVRDNFYDPKMHGLDWDAVGDRYLRRAAAASSKAQFQVVVNEMLDELHASHLTYWTDDDMEFYFLQSVFADDRRSFPMEHIGVTGTRESGVFVVRAVLDGSPAAAAGLKVGDRLLEAHGRPFSTVGAFQGRAGKPTELTLERPGFGRRTLTLRPAKQNPQQAFLAATRQSIRVIKRGGKRLGYIHLWSMTGDRFRQALEALVGKLADTDGLILDLRDGFGGNPFGFADFFLEPDIEWRETPRTGRPRGFHTGFAKPMVLLINHGSRSAKEFFTYQLKKSRRATVVGTKTAGAFLAARGFTIGSGGYLELPVMDLTLDGQRIEGAGVEPDLVAEAQDTYGPQDRQVARALEVLLGKLRAPTKAVTRRVV